MEITERFKAKTPVFFKRLRNLSLALAGLCGAVTAAYSQLPVDFVQTIPTGILKTIAITALVAAGVAQLTKET